MSLRALFRDATARILGSNWGARITDASSNEPKDTGVQQFAEELAAILSSEKPIELYEPIRITRQYNGPVFKVNDAVQSSNPFAQIKDRDGNETSVSSGQAPASPSTGNSTTSSQTIIIDNSQTTVVNVDVSGISELFVVVEDYNPDTGMVGIAPANTRGEPDGDVIYVPPFGVRERE